jgi:periplasmic copper chaperone A
MLMRTCLAVVLLVWSLLGHAANVTVEAPWVRATVPGQQASGAFMVLKSTTDAVIVDVSTPVADLAEVHQMTQVQGVMRMRAAPRLKLPAGQAVELTPGGYHVMLMGLKHSLRKGEQVPLTLSIEAAKKIEKLKISAEVRDLTATP